MMWSIYFYTFNNIVDPVFLAIMRFPLKKARLVFLFFFKENHF